MQEINFLVINKALQLLNDNIVDYILAYKSDLNNYTVSPYLFDNKSKLKNLVFNGFCGANLSKTLFLNSMSINQDKKICVFIKPCDTYSLNQLIKENKLKRQNLYIIGVECNGMLDIDKIKNKVNDVILGVTHDYDYIYVNGINDNYTLNYDKNLFLDKCLYCKGAKHIIYDELIIVNQKDISFNNDRFDLVKQIETMSCDERFNFWQNELSKCIRCNACRNICPACTCNVCIFDNTQSQIDGKVNTNSFEEKLYHIIKSYHVAGRCTDCGECSRVCPMHIPLHLLNRKYIKDINENFGEYQAGLNDDNFPLSEYKLTDKEVK